MSCIVCVITNSPDFIFIFCHDPNQECPPTSKQDDRCAHSPSTRTLNSYKDTRTQCEAQGITFIPMIMEAVGGGWGKMARCVWTELAKTSALASGELATDSTCAILLQQRLSMTLHRENARACLRRF